MHANKPLLLIILEKKSSGEVPSKIKIINNTLFKAPDKFKSLLKMGFLSFHNISCFTSVLRIDLSVCFKLQSLMLEQ